jgi:hypothetical protein
MAIAVRFHFCPEPARQVVHDGGTLRLPRFTGATGEAELLEQEKLPAR